VADGGVLPVFDGIFVFLFVERGFINVANS